MKALKVIFSIIGGVLVIAAVLTAIFVFKDRIADICDSFKDRFCCSGESCEEFSDFADV